MPDVARSIIVSGGIGAASPFQEGYLAVIGTASPPEVASTFVQVVNDGFSDGLAFTGGTGGYISDNGELGGFVELRSELPDGGGVYLVDFSAAGIYLLDQSEDSAGIYIISGDNGAATFSGGVFIRQEAPDSVGIYIEEASTDGNADLLLSTVNAPILLEANGAEGSIVLDASQVVRFGAEAASTPIGEVGANGAVFGGTYADGELYKESGDFLVGLNRIDVLRAASPPAFKTIRVNGTFAAPTAILNNDVIGTFDFRGWNGTSPLRGFVLSAQATENWGAAALGTKVTFRIVPNGSATLRDTVTVENTGRLTVPAPSASGESILVTGFGGAGVPLMRFNGATDGAGVGAGTLANAPVAGDPAFWLPISIAGTVRYIPCW